MSESIVSQSKKRTFRRFPGTGLQFLQPLTEKTNLRRPNLCCTYGIHGECNKINRVSPTHCLDYTACSTYQLKELERQRFEEEQRKERGAVSDPLSDTVRMSTDEVAGMKREHEEAGHYEVMPGNRLE